jgi:very-short-patch-repair endonuclease
MIKKRKKREPSQTIICQICGKEFKGCGIGSHIKYVHHITTDEYVEKYGELRSQNIKQQNNKKLQESGDKKIRNLSTVTCEICGETFVQIGFDSHINNKHDMTTSDYIKKYGEYRTKYLNYNKRAEKNKIECLICHQYFGSHRLLAYHLRIDHDISNIINEYVTPYVFKNKVQLCKCGCKNPVTLLVRPPYKYDHVFGHAPNGMTGRKHTDSARSKMKTRAMSRIYKNNKYGPSKLEIKFKKFLIDNDIIFTTQAPIHNGFIDFYLPKYDKYIEIDGTYWHPTKLEHLNLRQVNNAYKSILKSNELGDKLIRIKEVDLDKINTIDDIFKYNTKYDIEPIEYKTSIVDKNTFVKIKSTISDTTTLKKYKPIILHFLKLIHPEFPYPPITETPSEIITKIQTCNKSNIITTENNIPTFNNNAAFSAGVTYLKSTCKSYWKSSFKNSVSPVEAWYDDDVMEKIIAYRIGLNNSGEVFDLSLHQIIKGLSASRYSISFFKPVLAFSIYKYILGDGNNPIVFDPCCGFGGRLVGFKAAYPNGTYIGCEPNTQTYNELLELVSHFNFNDVKLFNCKLEDLNENIKYDIGFTSIPYFNKETYSKQVNYNSIDDWKNTFVNVLNKYHDMYVNLPIGLIENNNVIGYVGNSTSHWNSKKDKKKELIIKIN